MIKFVQMMNLDFFYSKVSFAFLPFYMKKCKTDFLEIFEDLEKKASIFSQLKKYTDFLNTRGQVFDQDFSYFKHLSIKAIGLIGTKFQMELSGVRDKITWPIMFAIKAKIYGELYKQSSSIAFDETSSYWSVLNSF